jgi:hypothetical protein
VNAKVRYSNAQFRKLSEIALRELAGNLNFNLLLLKKSILNGFIQYKRLVYIYFRFHKADTFRTLMPIMFAIEFLWSYWLFRS